MRKVNGNQGFTECDTDIFGKREETSSAAV